MDKSKEEKTSGIQRKKVADTSREPYVKEYLSSVVTDQRERLMQLLYTPLQRIAALFGQLTDNIQQPMEYRSTLDSLLIGVFSSVPQAKYLYLMNLNGVQISSSMSREGLIIEHFGRDRSDRPYMQEALSVATFMNRHQETSYQQWPYLDKHTQAVDFLLCEAYISQHALRPSMTAIFFLRDPQGNHIGFLGTDFAMRDLPPIEGIYEESRRSWHFTPTNLQEPARQVSRLDRELDTVASVLEELIRCRGVYHVKIHFSTSQTVVWVMDDPYRYRILGIADLLDPDSCLAYPCRTYSEEALIQTAEIRLILERMKVMRRSHNPIYLRSCSLNIFNGMVGVSFSSDGSHYIPYEDFLQTSFFD